MSSSAFYVHIYIDFTKWLLIISPSAMFQADRDVSPTSIRSSS